MQKGIIGFIIGAILFGIIGVYAGTTIASDKVSYDNTTSKSSATNVQGAIDELYSDAVAGKTKIAEALTNKGVETQSTDNYETMASNITNLSTGKNIVYLGTGSSFNVSSYPGYENFTNDNFIVGISHFSSGGWAMGYILNGYNSNSQCYTTGTSSSGVSKNYSNGRLTVSGGIPTIGTQLWDGSTWTPWASFTAAGPVYFAYLIY